MKVLVTGGAGFIGQHIVQRYLHSNDEVILFDHDPLNKNLPKEILENVEIIKGDILDSSSVANAIKGCDIAYHLAALVGVNAYATNPVLTMETEEKGLQNICHHALNEGCEKIIYPSSSAVYGNVHVEDLLDEDLEVAPNSNYGVAKRFNELYLQSQYKQNGLQSVALRIFNVYGPGQDNRLVIPRFITKALNNEKLIIFGNGHQTRDFPFIHDVVECAVRSALNISGHQIVNVSCGKDYSIRELAEKIIKLTNSSSTVVTKLTPENRTSFEVERCIGSNTKIKKLTGYQPNTSLDDGLRLTIESFIS
ncbi:MAG: NAD-dependent epimerase/dehydratase family protein [Methylocystaceae bacterium]|nr:NAD-dependent epimerase/dehydratase family protein [Methylocystaceae bacterium]